MIIRKKAYPRAGLVGNPSDGYFGKTIAFAFTNFHAEVVLYETPELEIVPSTRDHSRFSSMEQLAKDVRLFGYYGGVRLLKGTVRRFFEYCRERDIPLDARNFTIRYTCSIPHLVGLAGSSAIITACLRALKSFYGVAIPKPEEPGLALAVETEELGISAGLQDRVAQAYQGLVYMDFNRETMEQNGHGVYEELSASLLPLLYIAYQADLCEGSEVFHNNLSERFRRGEPEVLEAMAFWADLTRQARALLLQGRGGKLGPLLNANFDRRARLCRVSEANLKMIEAARSTGASAKFTGSGGAIVGTCENTEMFEALCGALRPLNVEVIRPAIAPPAGGTDE